MSVRQRAAILVVAALSVPLAIASPASASQPEPSSGGSAPGAPGAHATWATADKQGFGTATSLNSEVWFTLRQGEMSEVFYPDLGTPAYRDLEFVVTDGGTAERTSEAAVRTEVDARSLTYRQTAASPTGRWKLHTTYVTDPKTSTVLVDVRFESQGRHDFSVYALADPALSNTGDDDRGAAAGEALVGWDGKAGAALVASPKLSRTTTGYVDSVSDPGRDLADGKLDKAYAGALQPGNVVQAGRLTGLTGQRGHDRATLALGFGGDVRAALQTAEASLKRGFRPAAKDYARGWNGYLDGLGKAPRSAKSMTADYNVSLMTLAAGEDKRNRGAFVASPSVPWAWGMEIPDLSSPSGAYHLVWSRDQYQFATALLAAGDRGAANRALDFLLQRQQKPDGSFPQNSDVTGKPVWTNLQLDEVSFPMILAWQLGRTDAATYAGVKKAADFLLSFVDKDTGLAAPFSPQERWENQSGYSPATIASEIAGLVCAADLARKVGDTASADKWEATADEWESKVEALTVTDTGPHSTDPYYLRLTKDGNPNAGTTYGIGDGGPSAIDQRAVVDVSFLELVRLGVRPADDPAIVNSLGVVDRELGEQTPNGQFWHRFSHDGYGETRDGGPWTITDPDTFTTIGRLWPIFAGERAEYELVAGTGSPADRLRSIAATGNGGRMIAEQVWDSTDPTGQPGYEFGEGTMSATPLLWSHAQLVRLAWSIDAGTPVERPSIVACRYVDDC